MDDRAEPAAAEAAPPMVQAFRQILLYPLQLTRRPGQSPSSANWARLLVQDCVWQESTADPAASSSAHRERHYTEFVAFMPDVQRFLYGEGSGAVGLAGVIPPALRIFQRRDIVAAHVVLRPGERAIEFVVPRVELVFFHDVDLAMLVIEVAAQDLTLPEAQETLFRLCRAYPALGRGGERDTLLRGNRTARNRGAPSGSFRLPRQRAIRRIGLRSPRLRYRRTLGLHGRPAGSRASTEPCRNLPTAYSNRSACRCSPTSRSTIRDVSPTMTGSGRVLLPRPAGLEPRRSG